MGSGGAFFHGARSRCLAVPLEILARIYQARSDDPEEVARAYADREAPALTYRRAVAAGCLAGIDDRRRR